MQCLNSCVNIKHPELKAKVGWKSDQEHIHSSEHNETSSTHCPKTLVEVDLPPPSQLVNSLVLPEISVHRILETAI